MCVCTHMHTETKELHSHHTVRENFILSHKHTTACMDKRCHKKEQEIECNYTGYKSAWKSHGQWQIQMCKCIKSSYRGKNIIWEGNAQHGDQKS